jgi:hypothetical protein
MRIYEIIVIRLRVKMLKERECISVPKATGKYRKECYE